MLCIVLFQFYALGSVAGRLRVVPHLSSGIVYGAKRERA